MSNVTGTIEIKMAVGNEMKALFPQEYESKFWKERTRSDGRSFDQVRPTAITCNVISSMDSSCMVKTGSTTVLAGCKLEIGTPSVSSPNQGEIGMYYSSSYSQSFTF